MLCWAAGQPPAAASAPSGTRRHGAGTVPTAGSVSGHFPAFRQSLRDGVISGSGSSISASEAAHSSPWALLWAQPRLLYNLGFPEKLKREMKDSYQSSRSVPPQTPSVGCYLYSCLPPSRRGERKPAQLGPEDATRTQSAALRPRGAGRGEPWGADPGLCAAARPALAVNPSRPQAEVSVSNTRWAAPAREWGSLCYLLSSAEDVT